MSKTIRSWEDFRKYGINVLTGESDGLGLRLLCDVDSQGWALLDEFFGNTHSRNVGQTVGRILDDLEALGIGCLHTERSDRIKANLARLHELNDTERMWLQSPRGQGVNDYQTRSSGSILLPRSIFTDLAVFCLLKEPDVVAVADLPSVNNMTGGIYGWNDEECGRWENKEDHFMDVWSGDVTRHVSPRIHTKSTQPGNGFRNTNFYGGFTET